MPAPTLDAGIRTLRLIVVAMILGIVVFAAIVVGLVFTGAAPLAAVGAATQPTGPSLGTILFGALIAVALGSLLVRFVIGTVVANRLRNAARQTTPGISERELAAAYSTLVVVRGALAEGPALFSVVVLLLTGNALALLVTFACLIALVLQIPSRERALRFAQEVTGRPWPESAGVP